MENIQINESYIETLNKLKSENKISNWRKIDSYVRKSNIYVEKDYKIESILNSDKRETYFTLYKDYEEELGEATFAITESDLREDFEREVEDAIFTCSQSRSKKYNLPNKDDDSVKDSDVDYDSYLNKDFANDFNNSNMAIVIAQKLDIMKKLIENSQEKDMEVIMNYMEFHTTLSEKILETSEEIKKSYSKDNAYMEFCLTAIKDGKETEHIVYEHLNDIYTFDFEEFFKENIEYVKDSHKAESSKGFIGNVILRDVAIKDFFIPDLTLNPVVGHCSSRLKFQGISKFEKGDIMINSQNDKLTIFSNPILANKESSPFDENGITAQKVCLVKDSKFENYFASKQYADYLEIEPTGQLNVIDVSCGNIALEELKNSDEYIEIISFASFVPDMVSGDYSSEIRLGYHYKNGEKIPFKGGLFSGNVFKVLEKVQFSKESSEYVGYVGPKAMKLLEGEIVGL